VSFSTAANFVLPASEVSYTSAAANTYDGLATGGTLNLRAGGTVTLTNTAWSTPTTDSLTVNVGTSGLTGTDALTTSGVTANKVETITINAFNKTDTATTLTNALTATSDTAATIVVTSPIGATLAGGGVALKTVDASGVVGAFRNSGLTVSTAGVSMTGGAGADTLTGSTGNDTLIGGSGADSLTGSVGADVLTGGDGADIFVVGYDSTGATNVSNSVAMDTITDFKSLTDKIQLAQTNNKFLGNFANVTVGLGAMTATDQSFFVTSENTLYVVNKLGVLSATDTMVKLTNVASLDASDLYVGVTSGGADLVLTAAPSTLRTYDATTKAATTTAGSLTGSGDTLRVLTASNLDTANVNAGNGLDTLAIYAGASGNTTTIATTVTGFERITLNPSLDTTVTAAALAVTVKKENVAANLSTVFAIDASAVTGAGVTIDASDVGVGESLSSTNLKNLLITGGSFTGGDLLTGGSGNDTIIGGAGNDTIDGGAGLDSVSGGDGNDVFNVSATTLAETIDGGAGDDIVNLAAGTYGSSASGNVTIALGAGTNTLKLATPTGTTSLQYTTVTAAGGTYAIDFNGATATITMPAALLTGATSTTGTGGTQTVTFSSAGTIDATASALSAIEKFNLATGTNTITIGTGQSVVGNTGADTVNIASSVVAAAGSTGLDVIGNMNTGSDTVNVTGNTAVSVTLASSVTNVETITFANTDTNVSVTTNNSNIGTAGGTMTFTASALTTGTLTFVGTNEDGTASNYVVTGGGGADNISGGSGNDTLSGGSGNDTISGGAGDDSIIGGAGDDSLIGGDGNDIIDGSSGTGVDQVHPGLGVDLIYLTEQSDSPTASTVADRIIFDAGTANSAGLGSAATAGMNQIIGLVDASTRVISSSAVINVSGIDKIFGFGATSQLAVEGLKNNANNASLSLVNTIVRSGDLVSGNADSSSQGLVRGTYDPTAGTFTVSLSGTSSIYFYDADPSASVLIRGVVLVGYVDPAANDNGGNTGLIGVGG